MWGILVRWKVLMTRGLLRLGAFTNDPITTTRAQLILSSLHQSAASLLPLLQSKLWIPTVSSAVFFAFVCWDISGDAVGWKGSFWVPCLTLSLILVVWFIVLRGVASYYQRRGESGIEGGEEGLKRGGGDDPFHAP
jgi:hypothetical protein